MPPQAGHLDSPVGGYMGVVGAGFAAAHVSGASAVLFYEATKSAAAARNAVLNTAEDWGPREAQGRGLLRIDRALGVMRRDSVEAAPGVASLGLAAFARSSCSAS